jgi:hypothetical protein
MIRFAKAFLFVGFFIVAACASAPEPVVITVTTPYVATLPLDPEKNPGLDGRVICDLLGYPVKYVRLGLSARQTRNVLHHETVHSRQALAHPGGCLGLREEMSRDSMFRLRMEAAAFCNVHRTERAMKEEPDPSWSEIFKILSEKYHAAYEPDAVTQAMALCGG